MAELHSGFRATAAIDMGSHQINNVVDPSTAQDAATKNYVDTVAQGLSPKSSAVAATTGSESFTITAGSVTQISGITVDGVSPSVNDRILVKDAPAATGTGSAGSSQPGNGIYVVTSNTTNLSLSRAVDMDDSSDPPAGAFVLVESGTANASAGYVVSVPSISAAFTYGTNNIAWTQFSGAGEITVGTGLSKSGNTLSVSIVPVANGGTNSTTAQTAINTLTGTQSAGKYLRSDGANATLATIQAADVPTLNQNTTGNASTVTTNANLTGPITSVGNATSIASQTGTGSKFVVDTSPTLITPNIGVATGSSLNLGAGSLNTVGNIEVDGTAARDLTVGRQTSGTGADLVIQGGGAQTGATDTTGGNIIIAGGIGTGNNGSGNILFKIAKSGQGTGTTDRLPSTEILRVAANSSNGRVSIGFTSNPSADGLTVGGELANMSVAMGRRTSANSVGRQLTLQSGGATSAAIDKASGDLVLTPGISTGIGGANVRVQTMTRAASTGTADNTATDRIIAQSPLSVTNNVATTVSSMTLASGSIVAGRLSYTVEVTNGTDYQYETGVISYGVTNKAGTIANNVVTKFGNQQAATTGTLVVTFTITAANPALIQVNANSSLTPSTGYPRVTFVQENLSQQAVAIS